MGMNRINSEPYMLLEQLALAAKEQDKEIPFKVPRDLTYYNKSMYRHWSAFEWIHLHQAFDNKTLLRNAELIASIAENDIPRTTIKDLSRLGVVLDGEQSLARRISQA